MPNKRTALWFDLSGLAEVARDLRDMDAAELQRFRQAVRAQINKAAQEFKTARGWRD